MIYTDFYNGGIDNYTDVCRNYHFYDEEGKLIRREYKWDSNAQWYEAMGGKPNVAEYEYTQDGILSKVTFLNPPDYWVTRVDYYDDLGVRDHGIYYDRDGNVTKEENYKETYNTKAPEEDWEILSHDATVAFNKGNFDECLSLLDKEEAIHPEDGSIYLTRFWCILTPMWNDDGTTAFDLNKNYDLLVDQLNKAEQYGEDPELISYQRKMLEIFVKYLNGEGELKLPSRDE